MMYSLDRNTSLANFLCRTARSEEVDTCVVQPMGEVEKTGLVVDRQQSFETSAYYYEFSTVMSAPIGVDIAMGDPG